LIMQDQAWAMDEDARVSKRGPSKFSCDVDIGPLVLLASGHGTIKYPDLFSHPEAPGEIRRGARIRGVRGLIPLPSLVDLG